MAFSEKILVEAWDRSSGRCECENRNHHHFYTPCGRPLSWAARGMAGPGGWEAHHITTSGGDGIYNCEILCWECFKSASGFAVPGMFSGFYRGQTHRIQIGDYIRLESGEEGHVNEVGYNSIRIKTIEGNETVISESDIRQIVVNYGPSLRKAKEPFKFFSLALLTKMTGLKARNLTELTSILKKVSESVIYYHTHQFLQEHHYLTPEPANDFSVWVVDSLGDEILGERLACINPFSFPDLYGVRERIVNIIEEHLGQYPNHREAMEGKEFFFLESTRFVFPTPYAARDLREFTGVLRRISLSSLYYHIFESRLRSPIGLNDFSIWLMKDLGEEELGQDIARLDPYTYTLEGLRSSLIKLIEKHN